LSVKEALKEIENKKPQVELVADASKTALLYFKGKGGQMDKMIEQIDNAKSVCTDCEVRQPCLDFALATNQDSGIWGGTSEEERRKLRRQWLAARRKAS
jgi:WhiB family redox-sensing transcriptional regulator